MKKALALLLLAAMLLCMIACEKPTPTSGDVSGETSETSAVSSEVPEEKAAVPYGTYYIKSTDGRFVTASTSNTKIMLTDGSKEEPCRWTVYYRTVAGEKHYMIYRGELTEQPIAVKGTSAESDIYRASKKEPSNYNIWNLLPNEDGSAYQIALNFQDDACCFSFDGKGNMILGNTADKKAADFFTFEKAIPSEKYDEYPSAGGNIILRIPHYFVTRHSIGLTADMAQKYADLLQIAYEAEVELTGYVPYDVIVIKAYENEGIVAGVVDNYNVITVNVGFMQGEIEKFVYRYKELHRWDLGFAIMHEMGHMFDSQRAWNFESEAWTDLKLCYATKVCTERWKQPDGYPVALAPSDFGKKDVFTYEELDEMYTRCGHYDQGAMKTNYSFFAMAHVYLKIADKYGWDNFIKAFHYFQDAGETQGTYGSQLERYYAYANKLSEFIGKDPKTLVDEVNPTAWDVIVEFYTHGGKPL